MSKFSKDNKIARARRESAICSLWKIYKNLETPNCKRNHHLTCYYKISREMCAPWLVRKSSLYFHKARAFGLTSALLRYSARSLCRRYERTQFTIHFTKGIKKLVPQALLSYISTWEFLRTLEKCEKHSPSARAPPCLYDSTMHSARFLFLL